MDIVTHAAGGVAALLAMPARPATRWALPCVALAAAAPDMDILFAATPLQFLQLHRGISHSLAAVPLLGLALTIPAHPLWRENTPGRWPFRKVWLFLCGILLLHIWLDAVTTYGIMPFLPFSGERIRLNGIFIIDPVLTLPLLWVCFRHRIVPVPARRALAWAFFYPAFCVVLCSWHCGRVENRLLAAGRDVSQVTVLPDAFAPFYWRALFVEQSPDGPKVREQGLDVLGRPHAPESAFPAVPETLVRSLAEQSVSCDTFFDFACLPVAAPLPARHLPQDASPGRAYLLFHDLRFGSALPPIRRLMEMRPNADTPFLLMVELDGDGGRLLRERLLFADSRLDSGWNAPRREAVRNIFHWFAGLR